MRINWNKSKDVLDVSIYCGIKEINFYDYINKKDRICLKNNFNEDS